MMITSFEPFVKFLIKLQSLSNYDDISNAHTFFHLKKNISVLIAPNVPMSLKVSDIAKFYCEKISAKSGLPL